MKNYTSMTLRVKIVFIALIVVGGLLILFSVLTLVRYITGRKEAQPPAQEQSAQQTVPGVSPTQQPLVEIVPHQPEIRKEAKPGDEILSLTLPFVERFGSYSNQGNFENLSDLLSFMSPSMRTWAEKQIAEQAAKPFQELYRGVTTKALSYTMKNYQPEQGRAEMLVSTQRHELIGSTINARVYNQDVVVKFVKDDGAWVVDSAFWQ